MVWPGQANSTTYKNLDPRVILKQNNYPEPSNDLRQHNFCYGDLAKGSPPLPPFLTEAQLVKAFMRFDVNRDGRLSRQELKNAFESLGAFFPAYRAMRALRKADGNGDGYISEDEMDDLIHYASRCGYGVQ